MQMGSMRVSEVAYVIRVCPFNGPIDTRTNECARPKSFSILDVPVWNTHVFTCMCLWAYLHMPDRGTD